MAARRPAGAGLKVREFLHEVEERTVRQLDPGLGTPTSRGGFMSLQIHFGEPRLHYEVWPVRKTGRIEVGLHIEGPHDWSREVAAQIACEADDLRAALGPEWELEDWTESWSRLHTTFPLALLTEPPSTSGGMYWAEAPSNSTSLSMTKKFLAKDRTSAAG